MDIGIITDGLKDLNFDSVLSFSVENNLGYLEFGCGNYSSAPHLNLDKLLSSTRVRLEFQSKIKDYGLKISALNCSGNQLKPGKSGKKHDLVVRKTFKLANLLGLNRVVMMSGLPGGPGDKNPNWIITASPKENAEILKWQWEEVAIPYWNDLYKCGLNLGIEKICLENHGMQLVHNLETLNNLRDRIGPNIGANFDPSHIFWMGGDPLKMIPHMKDIIYHVHAKDTKLETEKIACNTLLEPKPYDDVEKRTWNYCTLGNGHDQNWWEKFIKGLKDIGYDDVLSIEHGDRLVNNIEGVIKSINLLKNIT